MGLVQIRPRDNFCQVFYEGHVIMLNAVGAGIERERERERERESERERGVHNSAIIKLDFANGKPEIDFSD